MNTEWHAKHPLRRGAPEAERIAWHLEHQRRCACRPIPKSLAARISASKAEGAGRRRTRSPARRGARPESTALEARPRPAAPKKVPASFARIVAALDGHPGVTYGGKGFGSTALKHDGKIFAMLTPSGEFVVKLPARRVDELIAAGAGTRFDTGNGRVMQEWLAVAAAQESWLELAREAYEHAVAKRR